MGSTLVFRSGSGDTVHVREPELAGEVGAGVDVEAGSMGAEPGDGIEAGAACGAMAPGSWMPETSGETGAWYGAGSC